jgi:hypothetical protein
MVTTISLRWPKVRLFGFLYDADTDRNNYLESEFTLGLLEPAEEDRVDQESVAFFNLVGTSGVPDSYSSLKKGTFLTFSQNVIPELCLLYFNGFFACTYFFVKIWFIFFLFSNNFIG